MPHVDSRLEAHVAVTEQSHEDVAAPDISVLSDDPFISPVNKFADDRIEQDIEAGTVHSDGKSIQLPPRLFNLLAIYSSAVDVIRTSGNLATKLYGSDTRATRANLHVNTNVLRSKFTSPDLRDPITGAIRTRRDLGAVAVSSLTSNAYLWNEANHSIIQLLEDGLALNTTTHVIKGDTKIVELDTQECVLLECLGLNQGITLSDPKLTSILEAQGSTAPERVLRVRMATLRKKIATATGAAKTDVIQTDPLGGYRLVKP